MNKKTVMAMPLVSFWAVVAVCVLGIVLGSFWDFDINVALANKTDIGAFFATYGSYFSYCLYPAAGACLFVGLKKQGKQYRMLAWTLLLVGWFLAVYYSNSYNGKNVRALFGYVAGESDPLLSVLSWLFWAVLYAWVPFVTAKLLDDKAAAKLIAIGAAILVAGIVADNVNLGSNRWVPVPATNTWSPWRTRFPSSGSGGRWCPIWRAATITSNPGPAAT